MKALVTGANGMLGQDLCPILEDEGFDIIETDINNMDICDFDSVKKTFEKEKPDYVFHCAAYTNVDGAEENFEIAKKINSEGTENIAKAADAINATLVYISTDYVFDGKKNTPYLPDDKPNPINKYGLTKLMGEQAVKKYCSKYYIVRTSWLYGCHGKNFVNTMLKLSEEKKEIKVVDDQHGCPTWTVDLAAGIIKILDNPFGTYHICGGGNTTWYNFAKEILSDIDVKVIPCSSNEFPRTAKRPQYSVMDNSKLCRNWKLALKNYLSLIV